MATKKSSTGIEYDDDGNLVYFYVDIYELFNVDVRTPGISAVLNKAFKTSKSFVPVDTGLMKKSYSMNKVTDRAVMCFFDPNKIVGKVRKGRKIVDYYPKYLKEFAQHYTWLDIIIQAFYGSLVKDMNILSAKLEKKRSESKYDGPAIDNQKAKDFLVAFYLIMQIKMEEQKKKEEEVKERKKKRQEEIELKKQQLKNK